MDGHSHMQRAAWLHISLVETAAETLGACMPCPPRGICVAGMVIPSQVRYQIWIYDWGHQPYMLAKEGVCVARGGKRG
jgi:hypothetical protein